MDNLEKLTWLRVQIEILSDLQPDGPWREYSLLKKWQSCHYSLSRREFNTLTTYLENERKIAVHAAFSAKYEQLRLFQQERPQP